MVEAFTALADPSTNLESLKDAEWLAAAKKACLRGRVAERFALCAHLCRPALGSKKPRVDILMGTRHPA